MYAIGFGGKYYTLWEIVPEVIEEDGYKKIINWYYFVKNLSKHREKAIAQYPDASIMMNLNSGMYVYKTTKIEWLTNDRFRFGKYKGKKFSDINDVNYTEWYFKACQAQKDDRLHYEELMKFLQKFGYTFVVTEDSIIPQMTTPEEHVLVATETRNVRNIMSTLTKKLPVSFVPTSNISEDGEYFDNGIIYKFPEVKMNHYNGFRYYMPVINGKGKRIKNKTVEVSEYEFSMKDIHTVEVRISKFNIR